jgi:hypothetical protein
MSEKQQRPQKFSLSVGREHPTKFSDATVDPVREGPDGKKQELQKLPDEQRREMDNYLDLMNVGDESKFSDASMDPIRDPEERERMQQQEAANAANQGELQGEGQRLGAQIATRPTSLDEFLALDLPPVPHGTILRFAFSPDNLTDLGMAQERMKLAEVADVLTINNPTPALMSHLIQSGQFTDAIFSGHGDENGIFITGANGEAEHMSSEDLAAMMEDSSIYEMLLNFCNGGQKTAELLNELGIATMSHNRTIRDSEAIDDAADFAEGSVYDVEHGDGGTIGNAKPPEAPAVSANPNTPEPIISWSGGGNNAIKGYNVYRDGQYLTTVKDGTTFHDTGAEDGSAHTYQVTAFDAFGRYSSMSGGVDGSGQATNKNAGAANSTQGQAGADGWSKGEQDGSDQSAHT